MKRRLGVALLVVGLGACTGTRTPAPTPTPTPAMRVEGGFIRDADNRVVILRGLNFSGDHKVPPYFDFHTQPDVTRMRDDWGFNSMRFVLEWVALEPQRGAYDRDYLAAVRQRLDWAQAAGLHVVLDMHQDVYGPGFLGGNGAPLWTCDASRYAAFVPAAQWFLSYLDPNVTACFDDLWNTVALQDAFAAAWAVVAAEFADHPAVLGFDVLNEPYLGSASLDGFERDLLQPFYERVVPAVRAHAPHWLAFLEPSSMRNLGWPTTLSPFPFGDVVYAPHSYDNEAEQGMGFDPARRQAILDNMAALAAEARALDAALWIGEYGGQTSHQGIVEYMTAEVDAADAQLAGTSYWHYGRDEGYGVLHDDGTEKADVLGVLTRPYPQRIAGTPTAWSFDAAGGVFELRFTAGTAAPTVVSAPARHYPGGPRVECLECTAVVDGNQVLVTATSQGAPVTVRLVRQ